MINVYSAANTLRARARRAALACLLSVSLPG
jgi:hypothetical protein